MQVASCNPLKVPREQKGQGRLNFLFLNWEIHHLLGHQSSWVLDLQASGLTTTASLVLRPLDSDQITPQAFLVLQLAWDLPVSRITWGNSHNPSLPLDLYTSYCFFGEPCLRRLCYSLLLNIFVILHKNKNKKGTHPDPMIPLLESVICTSFFSIIFWTKMFVMALLVIVRNWRWLRCPLMEEQQNIFCNNQTTE